MPIRLPCTCGKDLVLAKSSPGAHVVCPFCGAELVIPAIGQLVHPGQPQIDAIARPVAQSSGAQDRPLGYSWSSLLALGGIVLFLVVGLGLIVWVFLGGPRDDKAPEINVRAEVERRRHDSDEAQTRFSNTPLVQPPARSLAGPPLDGSTSPSKQPAEKRIHLVLPVQVDFLRSSAKGNRFVIIADRSGSMAAPVRLIDPGTNTMTMRRSIDCLHEELIKTLKSFPRQSFFYVSFFDDRIIPMPLGDNWLEGGQSLEPFTSWIKSIQPRGGTLPMPAFQRAFALDPRPDVIFFMTDGLFPSEVVTNVALLNSAGGRKVTINTIQFDNSETLPPGFNRSRNRYASLLESHAFPEDVAKRFEFLSGHVVGRGLVPGFLEQDMAKNQLEAIAKESGGTFTVFGGRAFQDKERPKAASKRKPLLGLVDQLVGSDPINPHRRGSRYKPFHVEFKAGTTYEIDMAAGFDTYLFLEDSSGRLVASNDDAVGLNSMINFRASKTARYRILASSFGNSAGWFVLTVIDRALPGGP